MDYCSITDKKSQYAPLISNTIRKTSTVWHPITHTPSFCGAVFIFRPIKEEAEEHLKNFRGEYGGRCNCASALIECGVSCRESLGGILSSTVRVL